MILRAFILVTALLFLSGTVFTQSTEDVSRHDILISEIKCEIDSFFTIDTLDKQKIFNLLQTSLDLKDTVAFFKLSLSVSKDYYYPRSKHAECLKFLESSESLLNNKSSAAGSHYLHLGNHNLALNKPLDAMENFLKSLEWYKKFDPVRATVPLGNLAAIYKESKDYDSALAISLEALTYSKLLPNKDNRLYNLTFDYTTIADLYRRLGDMELADEYFQMAIKTSNEHKGKNVRAMAIEQSISFYSAIDSNDYTQFLIELGDSIMQTEGAVIRPHIAERFTLNKSHHYLKMNQVELAVHPTELNKENIVADNDRLEYAIRYYELINDKENEIIAYKELLAKKKKSETNYSKVVSTVLEGKEKIKESHSNISTLKRWVIYLLILVIVLFSSVFFYKRRSNNLEQNIQRILSVNTFNISKLQKYRTTSKQNKQYFTAVAHDIRSPIMKLKLLNEKLQSKGRKDVDSLIKESEQMNKEIDAMLIQLEQFLLNQKKELAAIENIDLNALFDDCTNLIDPSIIKPFSLEIIGNKVITSNRNSLKVILKNCIENSMKYCNGNLIKFVLTVNKEDENYIISFVDNSTHNNASQTITQSINETGSDSSIESFGLGLEICKLSAERLGGWFKVDNKHTEGFKVDFSLGHQN